MAQTPLVLLNNYAVELRQQGDFFADIPAFIDLPDLELSKNAIVELQKKISPHLSGTTKEKFDLSINEAAIGIKALIRSIHREKDASKQFFKDANEVADYLRAAASLLSLFPIAMFIAS